MRRLLFGFFVAAFGWLLIAPAALAFNTQITVYASVPQMRNIYVNKAGLITKVAGNTAQNIKPQVLDENNQPLPMTDAINRQYQEFLKSHDNHLAASKVYYVNPLRVDSQPNTQTIKIESASLTLGGGRNG